VVGWVPRAGDLDLSDLAIEPEAFKQATNISLSDWKQEIESQGEFFGTVKMPAPLKLQRELLLATIETAQAAQADAAE
jgi:GTP-dependent phosphoenolpyruvate carboxykinase